MYIDVNALYLSHFKCSSGKMFHLKVKFVTVKSIQDSRCFKLQNYWFVLSIKDSSLSLQNRIKAKLLLWSMDSES